MITRSTYVMLLAVATLYAVGAYVVGALARPDLSWFIIVVFSLGSALHVWALLEHRHGSGQR